MSFIAYLFHGIVFRGVACAHQKLGSIFGHNGYNFFQDILVLSGYN